MQKEADRLLFRKLCFVAHVVYQKYAPSDSSGAMKDENSALLRICEDVFLVDDVINPITSARAICACGEVAGDNRDCPVH